MGNPGNSGCDVSGKNHRESKEPGPGLLISGDG